jgi:hypothetical protein
MPLNRSERTRFESWLRGQQVRGDDVGRLAREFARGKVALDGTCDPNYRWLLFAATIEWRRTRANPKTKCAGCGHMAAVHGNTSDEDNIGACATPGCDCPGMLPPGDSGDPADNESSKPRRRRPLPVTGKSRSVRRQASPVCPHCRRPGGNLQVNSSKRGQSGLFHRTCFAELRGRPAHIGAAGVYGGRTGGVRTTNR